MTRTDSDCALTSLPNLTFLIEAVYRYLFGLGPAHVQPASVAASRSVSQHGYRRYLCLSVDGQSNEITYLPVNQLHLRAHSLVAKFEQGGGSNHIDEAIILDREALELCPPGHPQRAVSVAWLAIHLSDRFDQLGARRDLEEAIVFDREALEFRPQGHPDRSMSLNNLAACVYTRYTQLGEMEDLDEAIVLDREALDLRPPGHPLRSSSLHNLAIRLSTRYKQLGAMEDLDGAIVLTREALGLYTPGHRDRSMSLNNLAVYLSARYNQLGSMQDLDEAIVLDREALDLHPPRHHLRSIPLNTLANCLSTRYKQLGGMKDLDEAIALGREALDLHPQGHPLRSSSLNNLAIHFSTRYNQLGETQDLDVAIVLAREALDLRPQGHTHRSESLHNLALYLGNRFTWAKHWQLQDKEELFGLYAQLVHVSQIVSSKDFLPAKAWIRVAEHFQHPTLLLAYETSLRLLIQHLATLPSLPRHLGILKSLTSSLAVDAFSACLRTRAPGHAVELLEQGRGVFWSQLIRLRSPLDDVIASGPAGRTLADEFTRLVLLIRNALNSPAADQHERVCRLNLKMQTIVTNIRKLPNHSRFLLPSLFPDLQRAASAGPVIIVNASKYGCDALVVLLDRDPVHIPLQITQENVRRLSTDLHTLTVRAKRVDVTKELAFFLRTLWDQIVSPIVDFLQTIHPSQSRIWWCPTAEFSVLPLHAAGPYRRGQQNLPHLYI